MKKSPVFLIILMLLAKIAAGQSANAPFSETYYHWIDRWEIKTGQQQDLFHNSFKPYQRKFIGNFLENIDSENVHGTEKNLLEYLKQDNWEWVENVSYESEKPIFKYFYRSKSDFYHVKTPDFDLHVNPIIDFSFGKDTKNDITTYRNTRGIRLRGVVDDKVAFFSSITENQVRVPEYVSQYDNKNLIIPHVGFVKTFKENGYDYFDARGYISFNATKHINLQLGHDKFKIGNGYRSMMLSDFSPAYFFFKVETRVWKINYTNLFTELTADVVRGSSAGSGYPDKYGIFHHLSIDIGKKLNLGLFEATMIGGADGDDADIELEYLNPIIFYRAIEQQNGSSYNALVGADFQWLPVKGVSLYGQLILDEFLLEHLRAGDGWWGNKFGVQAGAEWINAFKVPTLDLQGEINLARPFTYTHFNTSNSYSHYRQPLAHPLGANFSEMLFIVRYQPVKNLFTEVRLINAVKGLDQEGENWGGNILLNYANRSAPTSGSRDFGHEIGQGVRQDLRLIVLQASYMIKHNLFIDGTITARNADAEDPQFSNNTLWVNGGIRWNIFPTNYDF